MKLILGGEEDHATTGGYAANDLTEMCSSPFLGLSYTKAVLPAIEGVPQEDFPGSTDSAQVRDIMKAFDAAGVLLVFRTPQALSQMIGMLQILLEEAVNKTDWLENPGQKPTIN